MHSAALHVIVKEVVQAIEQVGCILHLARQLVLSQVDAAHTTYTQAVCTACILCARHYACVHAATSMHATAICLALPPQHWQAQLSEVVLQMLSQLIYLRVSQAHNHVGGVVMKGKSQAQAQQFSASLLQGLMQHKANTTCTEHSRG